MDACVHFQGSVRKWCCCTKCHPVYQTGCPSSAQSSLWRTQINQMRNYITNIFNLLQTLCNQSESTGGWCLISEDCRSGSLRCCINEYGPFNVECIGSISLSPKVSKVFMRRSWSDGRSRWYLQNWVRQVSDALLTVNFMTERKIGGEGRDMFGFNDSVIKTMTVESLQEVLRYRVQPISGMETCFGQMHRPNHHFQEIIYRAPPSLQKLVGIN